VGAFLNVSIGFEVGEVERLRETEMQTEGRRKDKLARPGIHPKTFHKELIKSVNWY
jgi:hypothetical protein